MLLRIVLSVQYICFWNHSLQSKVDGALIAVDEWFEEIADGGLGHTSRVWNMRKLLLVYKRLGVHSRIVNGSHKIDLSQLVTFGLSMNVRLESRPRE